MCFTNCNTSEKEKIEKGDQENEVKKEEVIIAQKSGSKEKRKTIPSFKSKEQVNKVVDIEQDRSGVDEKSKTTLQKRQEAKQSVVDQGQDREEVTTISLLAPIPSLTPLAEKVNSPNIALAVPPAIKTKTPVNLNGGARRFLVGIYYAPARSYRNIVEPDQLRRRRLDDQEKAGKVLLSGGLRIGYRLAPHWTLESGLQLTKTEIQSTHRARLAYDRNQEVQNNNGGYDSNYRMTLSTSLGDIDTDVALTRNAATTVPANLPTFVFFDLQQNFTQVRIPLTIRYERGGQKFRWSVRSGFATSFILDPQIQITRVGLNRAGLRTRQTRIVKKFEGLNDKTLDYLIAFGLNYQVTPSISLMLEPSFLQSLTPAFERGDSKTYPNLLSLNVGVNYHF